MNFSSSCRRCVSRVLRLVNVKAAFIAYWPFNAGKCCCNRPVCVG
jgi:hypothetical protein